MELIALFKKRHPEVLAHVAPTVDGFIGYAGRRLLSPLTRTKLERILGYLLDENEFLSPLRHPRPLAAPPRAPLRLPGGRARSTASSTFPATPTAGCSGATRTGAGRSGCRSTRLIVRGLLNLYAFYGDDFKVECPTGSGNRMTLFEVAKEISRRLSSIFLRDASGRRPVLRRRVEVPGRPALARPHPLLRVLPRRQRGRHRGQPPDRLDRPRRAPPRPLRTRDGRRTRWRPPRRSSRPAWSGSRWAATT